MIRINLLAVKKSSKRDTLQQQFLAAIALVVITVVGCGLWVQVKDKRVEDYKSRVAAQKQELAELQKIIGEVNQMNAKKTELKAKLDVIRKLKKGKTGPVRALDDLATEIPKRVWITSMKESSGSVKLSGRALDPEDVSKFMKALQKSKYFSKVRLGRATAPKSSDGFYEFVITCSVNYSA